MTVMCERCGIDVPKKGMCIDCIDVLTVQKTKYATRVDLALAKEWVEMGIPLKEVAEELGRDRVTVQKWIGKHGWERFYWADAKGVGRKAIARFH